MSENQLLSEEEICRIWWEQNRRLYMDDVKMIPGYRWGWTAIPHFFHRPFYCYSYIFGYLIAIILFQNLMEKGSGFLDKIITLFSSGSSRLPLDMLKEIGLDPEDKTFWEQAFRYFDDIIDSLEMVKKG